MNTIPTSILEGKAWLIPRIVALQPATVLDIGAGEGTYARLLRPELPRTRFTAVEVWEPYLADYQLATLYNEVLIGDARTLHLPLADVVILGDVLEHMHLDDAHDLWHRARAAAHLAVFASIPIGHWPQGAVNGNVHETHQHDWTAQDGDQLPGLTASWRGDVIGCYQAGPA